MPVAPPTSRGPGSPTLGPVPGGGGHPLRRIAARTCGEHTAEDVEVEAWLIADNIAAKRGFPINFSHREEQEQVLAWLHNHLVKWADEAVRYAVKLDKDWDKEDADSAVHSMARLLPAAVRAEL